MNGNFINQGYSTKASNGYPEINDNFEQSYIENILRLNKGKEVCVYCTYPDSNEYRDKKFDGIIEASGRDHLILSDPRTGIWNLILLIYVDYIDFNERIITSNEFYPSN